MSIQVQVFLIDTGNMYNVDANVLQPVSCLFEEIERVSHIPVEQQVLLMSGGVTLFPDKPLGHYDIMDNPVYLICKSPVSDIARPLGLHQSSDAELVKQVEHSDKMPPSVEAVRFRTQLATRLVQYDKEELKQINQLVFDQHLQQQGWAAVVANLEDLFDGFEKRALAMRHQFLEFLKVREDISALIARMPEVLVLLEKVPVLPCLEMLASRASGASVSLKAPLEALQSFSPPGKLSLYTWINTQDPKHRLQDVVNDLTNCLAQMTEDMEERMHREVLETVKYTSGNFTNMKCIQGLENRLYGLDRLVSSARATIESQTNMAKGFEQNRTRLESLRDNSILPDLCASHKKQMKELLVNHRKLVDLKKKCGAAKQELSTNLQDRLFGWVAQSHRRMSEMDCSVLLYHDMLHRIRIRADFLRQVERAPHVYAVMVVEVARRRLFSHHYMKWAKGVADESVKEHKKESHRRRSFTKQYGSHFLHKMFVGFKDNVPKFAAEPPKDVDSLLPEITTVDIEQLARRVPELRTQLRAPTGTGSPSISITRPLSADGGSDPLMIEVTQSVLSSTVSFSFTTSSITSVTHSVSDSLDNMQVPLLEALDLGYQPELRDGKGSSEDPMFLSLQENNFPVPQCLSETLTAEVNSAAMSTISVNIVSSSPKAHDLSSSSGLVDLNSQPQQQQTDSGGGDGGPLFSSGDLEPTKSSDSSAPVSQNESLSDPKSFPSSTSSKKRRTKGKGPTDTSPEEGETSAEFTTADFYIEDSMPSSMTDSPGKSENKDRGKGDSEMSAALAQEKKKVEDLEGEMSALQIKLSDSDKKLSNLRTLLTSDITSLRESLSMLHQCVKENDSERSGAVSEVEEGIVGVLATLLEQVEREKEECMGRGRHEGRREVEEQLQAKCKLVDDLQQASLKVTHGIADLTKELQQTRECYQREIVGIREKHESEVQELKEKASRDAMTAAALLEEVKAANAQEVEDLRNKNLLEMELEVDKIREEMQQAMDAQEEALQSQITELQQQLSKAQQDKSQTAENMEETFNQKVQELQKILAEEKTKCTDLQKTLEEEKENNLKQIKAVEEAEREKYEKALQEEQEEMIAVNSLHLQQEKDKAENDLKEEREKAETASKEERERMDDERKKEREELESQHKKFVEERVIAVERVWGKKLANRETELQREYKYKLKIITADIQQSAMAASQQAAPSTRDGESQSEGGETMSVEQHQELLTKSQSDVKEQVSQEYQKLLDEAREDKERCLKEKEEEHFLDKESALTNLRTEIIGEKQAQFNEAIRSAVQEKESTIQQLQQQLAMGSSPVDDETDVHTQLADVRAKEAAMKVDNQRLEGEIQLLQQQLRQYSEQYHTMTASAVPVSQILASESSVLEQSVIEDGSFRPVDWKQMAEMKEQKISELQDRLMSMSMTTSMRKEIRDKVSILTCNVGDLVLICLDERHGQYVVFTVNNTLHFLHNDCLEAMGLSAVEGAPRKNWVLAEIIDREYCQAKKPQNRFKVPVNTKFYRVKARLWTPPGSSSSASAAATSSSPTKSPPSSSSPSAI